MEDVRLRRLAGIILLLTPVAFNTFFTLLSVRLIAMGIFLLRAGQTE
jgi:hypothetical protein